MGVFSSDDLKALAAEFAPLVQGLVDKAVSAIPVAGPALDMVVDAGIAAVKAKNPSYFPSTGVQPVVQSPTASDVSKAMGNAPLVPASPSIPAPNSDMTLADLETAYHVLAAKVEALSAAAGLQESAAMAGH